MSNHNLRRPTSTHKMTARERLSMVSGMTKAGLATAFCYGVLGVLTIRSFFPGGDEVMERWVSDFEGEEMDYDDYARFYAETGYYGGR